MKIDLNPSLSGQVNRAKDLDMQQKERRKRREKMGKPVFFTLTNCPRKLKGISDRYNYKANMHNLVFKDATFRNVKYQASIITKCNFNGTRLIGIDFFNSNIKGSSFKNAVLKDVVFFNCNLNNVDFKGAQLERVAFISTNIKVAKNLTINDQCKIYTTYPKIHMDEATKHTLLSLSENEGIYRYKALHVNKNKLNLWCLQILLDSYGIETYQALCVLKEKQSKQRFFTVYSYKQFIEKQLLL